MTLQLEEILLKQLSTLPLAITATIFGVKNVWIYDETMDGNGGRQPVMEVGHVIKESLHFVS